MPGPLNGQKSFSQEKLYAYYKFVLADKAGPQKNSAGLQLEGQTIFCCSRKFFFINLTVHRVHNDIALIKKIHMKIRSFSLLFLLLHSYQFDIYLSRAFITYLSTCICLWKTYSSCILFYVVINCILPKSYMGGITLPHAFSFDCMSRRKIRVSSWRPTSFSLHLIPLNCCRVRIYGCLFKKLFSY